MGQQQLLLIALGVILVGVAIVVGLNLFSASYSQEVIDQAAQRFNEISADALLYYKTPKSMGGGEGSFVGYSASDTTVLTYTYTQYMTPSSTNVLVYLITKTVNHLGQPWYIYGYIDKKGVQNMYVYDPDKQAWRTAYTRPN